MYRYSALDHQLVQERVAQFRDQIARWKRGELTDDELRPLRLQNGLYVQRHAPMLRVAIPYGMLAAAQLRTLAHIARTYDRGYGHFSTRQNIQFNWLTLEDVPDVLAALAAVQMHAIQTCGNCVRNITTDAFAGVAPDEAVDPRPYCELMRQWSTFHPEFAFLPRKFKIAFSASASRTGQPRPCTTWAFTCAATPTASGRRCAGRRRPGPHAAGRPRAPRVPAMAPPARPISRRCCGSTTAMAAATTCTRRASRSWCAPWAPRPSRARSSRSSRTWSTARARPAPPSWRASRPISRRRPTRTCRPVRPCCTSSRPPIRGSRAGWDAACGRTACAATRRSRCRSSAAAPPRATPTPTRWTPSRHWPSATASANCASRTSRTSCSPTWPSTSSTTCGTPRGPSAWPRPTSALSPT